MSINKVTDVSNMPDYIEDRLSCGEIVDIMPHVFGVRAGDVLPCNAIVEETFQHDGTGQLWIVVSYRYELYEVWDEDILPLAIGSIPLAVKN